MATISFRCSDKFSKKLDEQAKATKLSKSKLIIELCTKGKIKVSHNNKFELQSELNRIGNNLNQISKYCNENKSIDKTILFTLADIQEQVRKLVNGS